MATSFWELRIRTWEKNGQLKNLLLFLLFFFNDLLMKKKLKSLSKKYLQHVTNNLYFSLFPVCKLHILAGGPAKLGLTDSYKNHVIYVSFFAFFYLTLTFSVLFCSWPLFPLSSLSNIFYYLSLFSSLLLSLSLSSTHSFCLFLSLFLEYL